MFFNWLMILLNERSAKDYFIKAADPAIDVNIQIIRIFIKMREMLQTQKDILIKPESLEKKRIGYDEDIAIIFSYLKKLLNPPVPVRRQIGFRRSNEREQWRTWRASKNIFATKTRRVLRAFVVIKMNNILQRCHINHKPVPYITLQYTIVGFINIFYGNHF